MFKHYNSLDGYSGEEEQDHTFSFIFLYMFSFFFIFFNYSYFIPTVLDIAMMLLKMTEYLVFLQNMRVYIGILMTIFNYISLNDHSVKLNVMIFFLYCSSRQIEKYYYYMNKFNNWCSVSTTHQII